MATRSSAYWLKKWRRRADRHLVTGLTTRGTVRKQEVRPRRVGLGKSSIARKHARERIRYRANHAVHLLLPAIMEIERVMKAKLWGEEYSSNPLAGKFRLNHDL